MRWEQFGMVVGGLICLLVTPWFAVSYFSAYGRNAGEMPPPWADWIDWPTLITADSAVSVYNRYGVIFGVALSVVVIASGVAVRREAADGTSVRRSWMVIVGGLGAVAVGSILEYGFGSVLDSAWGFFLENLGFLTVIVGTVLLGISLRREDRIGTAAAVAIALSGFVGVVIGVVLVGHLPSGPALIPIVACTVWGFIGVPFVART